MKKKEIYLWELGSLKELHRAQRKVDKAVKNFEKNFRSDLDEALEVFSWRDRIACVLGVADAVQSMIRYRGRNRSDNLNNGLLAGLMSHYHRRKARKAHHHDSCDC